MAFYGECDKAIRDRYFPSYDFKGVMLEIGAGEPIRYSLSKHFKEHGWRCICIEPNPKFVEQHKEVGNEIYQYACGEENIPSASFEVSCAAEGMAFSAIRMKKSYTDKCNSGDALAEIIQVEIKTLNTILSELKVEHLDLLCVDVEGWEIEVMKGFDIEKYNPKVIVLENINEEPDYRKYMDDRGFKLDWRDHPNDIYIRK